MEDETDVPITWKEFKAFFCQSLDEFKAFVDIIWSTIQKNFQYQLEEVMDWAAHLDHLQTVFWEFHNNVVILEPVLIRMFRNGLQPFIRAQAKQDSRWKDTWE